MDTFNEEQLEEEFKIGEYDFSIDFDNSIVDIEAGRIFELEIKGDADTFEELCENDDFEFSSELLPPKFCARNIFIGTGNRIVINEKNQNDFDTELCFMDDNDLAITLSIDNHWIIVTGSAYIDGKKYPLSIKMSR